MKKAIVLLSGGLDSTVALWWARSKGYKCFALSFDYGQRHLKELKVAKTIAKRAGVPITFLKFSLPWSQSSLTNRKKSLPHHSPSYIGRKIPSTYVPARNTLFLSFAMSMADQIGAEALVIGANAIDYSGYPDCRGPYLKAFERVARLGSRIGSEGKVRVKILSPLVKLTKEGIVRLGRKLNAPMHLTWSCYSGGSKPCGVCDSCRLRDKGFEAAS